MGAIYSGGHSVPWAGGRVPIFTFPLSKGANVAVVWLGIGGAIDRWNSQQSTIKFEVAGPGKGSAHVWIAAAEELPSDFGVARLWPPGGRLPSDATTALPSFGLPLVGALGARSEAIVAVASSPELSFVDGIELGTRVGMRVLGLIAGLAPEQQRYDRDLHVVVPPAPYESAWVMRVADLNAVGDYNCKTFMHHPAFTKPGGGCKGLFAGSTDGNLTDGDLLGLEAIYAPRVSAFASSGVVFCFYRGYDAGLYGIRYEQKWNHPYWSEGAHLYGQVVGCPAAFGSLPLQECVVRGEDNKVYFKSVTSNLWVQKGKVSPKTPFHSLGGRVTDPPAVVKADAIMHVLVRGTDGALYHKYHSKFGWYPSQLGKWDRVGLVANQRMIGLPAVVAAGGQLHAVCRAKAALFYRRWTKKGWSSKWVNLGGAIAPGSQPVLATVGARLALLVRAADGSVYWRWRNLGPFLPTSWSDWEAVGDNTVGQPAALALTATELHVFALRKTGSIGHRRFDWKVEAWLPSGGWHDLGGRGTTSPVAVSPAPGVIHLLVTGQDRAVYMKQFKTGWSPDYQQLATIVA